MTWRVVALRFWHLKLSRRQKVFANLGITLAPPHKDASEWIYYQEEFLRLMKTHTPEQVAEAIASV